MIPANDDQQSRAELRQRILDEMRERGTFSMPQAELDAWTEQAASILAGWAMEDGLSLEAIKAGTVPESSAIATGFWLIIDAVSRAHSPEGRKLVVDGVEVFLRVQKYSGDAALRNLQRHLNDGLAAFGLKGPHAETVALIMTAQALRIANEGSKTRLRDLRRAAGLPEEGDGEKPQD